MTRDIMPMDKPSILLIDDENDIVVTLKKGLELKGFEVDAFDASPQALQQFKPYRYDVVITEIHMPILNGFEVYKLIRKQDEKVRIFFMTAFEVIEQEVKLAFPNLPPKSFITKTITIEKLVTLIESPREVTQAR